jgi:hypothetical protein
LDFAPPAAVPPQSRFALRLAGRELRYLLTQNDEDQALFDLMIKWWKQRLLSGGKAPLRSLLQHVVYAPYQSLQGGKS